MICDNTADCSSLEWHEERRINFESKMKRNERLTKSSARSEIRKSARADAILAFWYCAFIKSRAVTDLPEIDAGLRAARI